MASPNIETESNDTTTNHLVSDHMNVIQELTKSNHVLFLCLNLFFARHRKGSWLRNLLIVSSPTDKAHRGVYRHAGSFFSLTESSLRVSSGGVAIANVAISLLSTPARSEAHSILLLRRLKQQAEVCHSDALKMQQDFRDLRQQIMDAYKQVGMEFKDYVNHNVPYADIDARHDSSNDVLLSEMLPQTIAQLARTIKNLVAWWDDVRIHSTTISGYLSVGADVDFLIAEWQGLRFRYQSYNKEVSSSLPLESILILRQIMEQQDYYKSELQHALPSRGLLSWFKK
ncbi:hypothetical protein EYR40_002787 [Pleurotus pulmonarius]|nr:hypothetical protein EYR36_003300 [Pleurotus pulmonarius]KAF4581769.1 hypothetical protein EYR40_002787 [Pleurotus pulmonarius]KAF4582362.1 hypothetical protein EYR38_002480 [Pleurotus pulmonarius]